MGGSDRLDGQRGRLGITHLHLESPDESLHPGIIPGPQYSHTSLHVHAPHLHRGYRSPSHFGGRRPCPSVLLFLVHTSYVCKAGLVVHCILLVQIGELCHGKDYLWNCSQLLLLQRNCVKPVRPPKCLWVGEFSFPEELRVHIGFVPGTEASVCLAFFHFIL